MEQMTSICDMVGQIMQKKEEERRIVEEQAAKEDMSIEDMRHEQQLVDYKIKEITNDLGYKRFHGKKIDEKYERDCEIRIRKLKQDFNEWGNEVRKKEQDYNEEQYAAARRRMLSIPFVDEDDYIPLGDIIARYSTNENLVPIPNVILREKLLNVHRLIVNIKALNDNPSPDRVLKSLSLFPIPVEDSDSFFEKSDTLISHLDNSLPEFETFSDDTEETRSGSTTTHANNSLPEYDSFLFEIEVDQGGLTSVVISDNSNDPLLEIPEFESFHFDPSFPRPPPEPPDIEICLNFEPDTPVINNFDELNEDECFDPGGGEINDSQNVEDDDSFTFVIRTFLPYRTYSVDSPLLLFTGSEDTIFNPGISI
ncbi:hypothetical protein Tco_1549114 [Tanacetum coccineum]